MEDLPRVPGTVGRRDRQRNRLRTDQRAARERDHVLASDSAAPHERLGDQDPVAVAPAPRRPLSKEASRMVVSLRTVEGLFV
ncbi:hypothetical protein SBRY_50332 [Actinacidiphila bryophytorum]|uniref:Uncharacterized protein n=1 Tax=Actinacidiphila bryophytorum TaxID=1436133 RepID=A0A9W4H4Q2_9ACTN|nr:hypothetical protein SBRY_50332 [Actinacidiphila bryophytorum]